MQKSLTKTQTTYLEKCAYVVAIVSQRQLKKVYQDNWLEGMAEMHA